MKNVLLTAFFFMITMICSLNSFGQRSPIRQDIVSMSVGSENALIISLPSTNVKTVEKEWGRFLKQYKVKTKKNKSTKELFADDAKIGSLSNNTTDVYATVRSVAEEVELTVWFDLGGSFLDADNDKYIEGEKILMRFGLRLARLRTEAELKSEQKTLKRQKKDLKQLKSSKERLLQDIEDYKAKIKQAEADIKVNEKDQETKNDEIKNQKELIIDVKSRLKDLTEE